MLGAIGLVLALGSRMPLASGLYDTLVGTLPGEAIRESQRLLPLYLVWLAPAAALGARRLAAACSEWSSGAFAALPLAVALVLVGPGLFGLNGRLDPVSFPADWACAERRGTEPEGRCSPFRSASTSTSGSRGTGGC